PVQPPAGTVADGGAYCAKPQRNQLSPTFRGQCRARAWQVGEPGRCTLDSAAWPEIEVRQGRPGRSLARGRQPRHKDGEARTVALACPGQGSQAVGMGRSLADAYPSARAVFDEVDDALGERLSRILWEGPAETLTLTENAQPGLMAVSLAALAALR